MNQEHQPLKKSALDLLNEFAGAMRDSGIARANQKSCGTIDKLDKIADDKYWYLRDAIKELEEGK